MSYGTLIYWPLVYWTPYKKSTPLHGKLNHHCTFAFWTCSFLIKIQKRVQYFIYFSLGYIQSKVQLLCYIEPSTHDILIHYVWHIKSSSPKFLLLVKYNCYGIFTPIHKVPYIEPLNYGVFRWNFFQGFNIPYDTSFQ